MKAVTQSKSMVAEPLRASAEDLTATKSAAVVSDAALNDESSNPTSRNGSHRIRSDSAGCQLAATTLKTLNV